MVSYFCYLKFIEASIKFAPAQVQVFVSACNAVCNVSKFSVKDLRLCSQPQWQDYGLCETEFLGCDSFHLTLMLCSGHFDQERIFFLPKMLRNVIELD